MDKQLHIICLNVPYPADYGGVFDLFYKLSALQKQGVKIHLHCFEYGRGAQPVLNNFCETVHYYKRRTGITAFSFKYPYIVSSRINQELIKRLSDNDYPVLMEGVHCTYPLLIEKFSKRRCFVRLHNVEHIYYRHLCANTTSFLKKLYFTLESLLLKKYERSIVLKATFWGVIEKDNEAYRRLGCNSIDLLPLFLPPWQITSKEGKGLFCLYQGDMSVGENDKAAQWLITQVFDQLEMHLVIAGKNPSPQLVKMVENKATACLIANPTEAEMQDLIEKAHINIIPSYNSTGIKIKLINALFNSRHCLVNQATVEGTGLEQLCFLADDAPSFRMAITKLYQEPFTDNDVELRKQLLYAMFNNDRNAKQMVKWIWEE